jgi:hypothetical protein
VGLRVAVIPLGFLVARVRMPVSAEAAASPGTKSNAWRERKWASRAPYDGKAREFEVLAGHHESPL